MKTKFKYLLFENDHGYIWYEKVRSDDPTPWSRFKHYISSYDNKKSCITGFSRRFLDQDYYRSLSRKQFEKLKGVKK